MNETGKTPGPTQPEVNTEVTPVTIEAPAADATVSSDTKTEIPGFAEGATLLNIPIVAPPEAQPPAPAPAVTPDQAPTVQIPAAEMARLVAAPTPTVPTTEAPAPSIEQLAAGLPDFVQELQQAKTALDAEPVQYGNLGSQASPLEGVTLANAALRSLFSDGGEPAWIQMAGQLVKVDASNRRCTIWQSFTDEQEQSKAPGFDWEAIAKLKREAAVIASKPGATETRLEVIKPGSSAQ